MQPLNLLTSLVNFKNYIKKPLTNTTDDFVIEKMIMAASMDIESYTRRKLRGRTYGDNGIAAEYHNGNGLSRLFPKQYPIISISELYDDLDRSFGSDTLKASTDYTIFSDEGIVQLNSDAVLGSAFSVGTANIKLIYSAGYDEFQVISGVNNRIDFEETASAELTATIAEGIYTASSLATAIDTALTAAGASDYRVTYDYFNGKFKLASNLSGGGGTFKVLWNSGTNRYRSAARLLGFQDDGDDSTAASHESDDSVLGIPADLEYVCMELTLKKWNDSKLGAERSGLKSKAMSGQNAGTTSYVQGMPEHAKEILQRYKRQLV